MRKIYVATLSALLLSSIYTVASAQRKIGLPVPNVKKPVTQTSVVSGTTADCDTANYPINPSWSGTTYVVSDNNDFINGTNSYGDKQKANYFNLSATAYTYLTSVFVVFGEANSLTPANLTKNISFKVYSDNAGKPGTLLATETRTLSEVNAQVEDLYEVKFATAVALPDSKKFYVSVDISNFAYPDDLIWIAGTADGEVSPNQAWEQWSNNAWYAFSNTNAWGFSAALWIFPSVSTSAAGCSVLPVKLLSFNAQRNNKDVILNWQIAEEYNMKGYEVERADNNGAFKTVISTPALNYAKNQSYSVTDKNAFASASTVQYRLKQIDGDGSVKYSRVIFVKANTIISDISFANPFNGALKLQLNLATAQNISLQVFDMQGKPVVSQLNKMYNASSNSIILNGTSALKPGMYVLKINAGAEQLQYKIIKQ
ncbi:hypothetical protein BH10BAC2_BH10BAC2_11620 [soil metagenome]